MGGASEGRWHLVAPGLERCGAQVVVTSEECSHQEEGRQAHGAGRGAAEIDSKRLGHAGGDVGPLHTVEAEADDQLVALRADRPLPRRRPSRWRCPQTVGVSAKGAGRPLGLVPGLERAGALVIPGTGPVLGTRADGLAAGGPKALLRGERWHAVHDQIVGVVARVLGHPEGQRAGALGVHVDGGLGAERHLLDDVAGVDQHPCAGQLAATSLQGAAQIAE